MATIANLIIEISARSAGVRSALNNATTRIRSFVKISAKILAGLGTVIGAGAVTAVVAITKTVNNYAAEIDKLAKTSSKLGITTGALQKLQYQAELSGVSVETMNMALQRMVRRVSEAAAGTGAAKNALAELGLNAQQLNQLSPDRQFYAISEAMKSIGNQGDKVRLAMKIFDTEGVSLVNTMSGNLVKVGEEFDGLGVKITASQAVMVEAYQDSKAKLSAIFSGFGLQLTAQLAEPFTKLIAWITESIQKMGGMGQVASKFSSFMIGAIIATVKGVEGLIKSFTTLENTMLRIENIKLLPAVAFDALGALDDKINKKPHVVSDSAQRAFDNQSQIDKNNSAIKDNRFVKELEDLRRQLENNTPEQNSAKTLDPGSKERNKAISEAVDRAAADKNAAEQTNNLAKAAGSAAQALTPKSQAKNSFKSGMTGFNDMTGRMAASAINPNLGDSPFFGIKGKGSARVEEKTKVLSMQDYIDSSPSGKALQDMRQGAFGQGGGNKTGFINGDFVNAEKFAPDSYSYKGKTVSGLLDQNKPKTIITLNMVTDAGAIAGELTGNQDFIDKLIGLQAKQTNKIARMSAN